MKSLQSYIMEQDITKEQRLNDRLQKNTQALEKANAQLEKTKARFDKLMASYKANQDLCNIIPYDIFNNFQYRTWREVEKYEKETGKNTNFPFNPVCGELYYKVSAEHTMDKDLLNKFYWDYFTVANDLIEKIHSIETRIDEYTEKLEKIAKNIADVNADEDLINAFFDKVPQMKTFIDTIGEKQEAFLIEKSEKLKEALKKWEETWKKFKEDTKDVKYKSFTDKYWAEENFKKEHKPKGVVMSKEDIHRTVEAWKRSESIMLATRITTEFGEVESAKLTIGVDGNVNGVIKGTLKSAKIETIWAGGYNIQCLHTRLLIHEK